MNRRAALVASALALATLALAGAAHANIEEQRARLPPPVDPNECPDPVEGVWQSHSYQPRWTEWSMFQLVVRRKRAGSPELDVAISNHSWTGTPAESDPPGDCNGGRQNWNIVMTGAGTTDGSHIEAWGTSWRIDRVFCSPWGGYNLDHFSGTIDRQLQEFQTVNNDGGRAVNEPTVFRRVRCIEPPPQPHVVVAPPPFFPSMHRGLCAVGF